MKPWMSRLLYVMLLASGFGVQCIICTPWPQIPWERHAHFERWCKTSSECLPLAVGDERSFEECWKPCLERLELVYQRTGSAKWNGRYRD